MTPHPLLYLGPEGTHSHEAALRYADAGARPTACLSHFDLFDRLCRSRARVRPVAVVPVENSSEGPVTQTLDQLASHPGVTIAASFSLAVRHHLLTGPDTASLKAVQRVYSHPQALGQCHAALRRLVPHAEPMPESSTAAAARRAASEPGSAALASADAARIYGLRVLRRNLQDSRTNTTRFFAVTAHRRTRPAARPAGEVRSLIHLVIGNRPGALLHALSPFDAAGLNLTFIQSRPLPNRPWEYGFFIEAVTDWRSPAAEAAWRLILALSESGRIIGTYPILP